MQKKETMSLPLPTQDNQGKVPPLTPPKPNKPRARSAPPRTRVKSRSIQLESFPKPDTLQRHRALAQEDYCIHPLQLWSLPELE